MAWIREERGIRGKLSSIGVATRNERVIGRTIPQVVSSSVEGRRRGRQGRDLKVQNRGTLSGGASTRGNMLA